MIQIPLLQTSFYQTQTDWFTVAVMGGVAISVVLGLVIYSRSFAGKNGARGGKRFSKYAFRREATSIGLSKYQTRLLEKFIQIYQVRKPFNLLSNTKDLNITLGKALRDIKNSSDNETGTEEKKLEIYRIKQRIDHVFADTNNLDSTKQLRLGQNITFQLENGNRFPSVVTANLKEFYCTQAPINNSGEHVTWSKGSRIKIYIWGADSEEMVFESRVMGYTNIKGITSAMLGHTNRVNRSIQRKYRRRRIKSSCVLYPVRIVEKGMGRKVSRKAIVATDQKLMGSMIDISMGGCAMSCHRSLPRGELVKISFEPQRGSPAVEAFGKVVDSRVMNKTRTTFHIMFTRASSKNLNRINEYVYDFE